eukprot:CAMPEP_0202448764 /NCGR_PEP_ID=MMETSP1360-20130828/7556_1 /ASSEMBLY_ACC=CAM_ASM_000848 /TAXON_ID=515479 /ORGANISM="Licmophora paradoxa, Strain CCMP2313" /LENGTH=493 /DNA_ID=CAMNT_0049066473 /DNA_START=1006 /DNA_END=2487 /DNA_ORIENTATION=-
MIEDAATKIQSCYRTYDQQQRYWYALGSAIQIQCYYRSYSCRRNFFMEKKSALKIQCSARRFSAGKKWRYLKSIVVIQCSVRRFLAKQRFDQMRLIVLLLAKTDKSMLTEGLDIEEWFHSAVRQRKQNAAAIKIQAFFRMVKAMVDREIRAEKHRRKVRKKLRNRTPAMEDEILDDAWDNISQKSAQKGGSQKKARKAVDMVTLAEMAVRKELKGRRSRSRSTLNEGKRRSSSAKRDGPSSRTKDGGNSQEKSRSLSRPRQKDSPARIRKKMIPPSYTQDEPEPSVASASTEKPAETVRCTKKTITADDDAGSEVSGITAPTVFSRQAPPRLKRMSKQEIDDDFSLEEAWIDTSINQAKQKKRTGETKSRSKNSSGHRRDSSRTLSSETALSAAASPQRHTQQSHKSRLPKSTMNTRSSSPLLSGVKREGSSRSLLSKSSSTHGEIGTKMSGAAGDSNSRHQRKIPLPSHIPPVHPVGHQRDRVKAKSSSHYR